MRLSDGPESIYSRLRLWMPAALLMGALVYASLLARVPPAGPSIVGFDKIAHFFVFGLMGTLFLRGMPFALADHRRWLLAWLAALSFGFADEAMQYFHPLRSFDPYDWLADASGAFLAITLYLRWTWYRQLLEYRLWGGLPTRRTRLEIPVESDEPRK